MFSTINDWKRERKLVELKAYIKDLTTRRIIAQLRIKRLKFRWLIWWIVIIEEEDVDWEHPERD